MWAWSLQIQAEMMPGTVLYSVPPPLLSAPLHVVSPPTACLSQGAGNMGSLLNEEGKQHLMSREAEGQSHAARWGWCLQ